MSFVLGGIGTLFSKLDNQGNQQLWITYFNGRTAQLTSANYIDRQNLAYHFGVNPGSFFPIGPNKALFVGYGPQYGWTPGLQLWVTDGTAAGTHELLWGDFQYQQGINLPIDFGASPYGFTTLFNNKVGFYAATAFSPSKGLSYSHFVTDGNSAWQQTNQSFVLAAGSWNQVNLGIHHAGDTFSGHITIWNSAPNNGYSETLDGRIVGQSGGVSASGSFNQLSAGVTDTADLTVTMTGSAAGTQTGTAMVALWSDGAGISRTGTTSLGSYNVQVTATIDNYAAMTLETLGGSLHIGSSGGVYTLNLGTIGQGGRALSANLGVLNSAVGPADLLSGTISASGATAFANTGFGAFSGLGADQADTAPVISLATTTPGTYTEAITLAGTGSNTSGYAGALAGQTLIVTGTVLPGPAITWTGIAPTGMPTSTVKITDPNAGQTETVSVALAFPSRGTFTNLNGGTYNSAAGTYTVTGLPAAVTAALDALVFKPTVRAYLGVFKPAIMMLVKTGLTIAATDSAGGVATDTSGAVSYSTGLGTIVPAINGTAAGQKTTDQTPVSPFANLAIFDFNSNPTETVTVTLSAAANGSLTNVGTGNYNATAGVYTVTGSPTAVTAAIDGLVFVPTPHQTTPGASVNTILTINDTSSAGTGATDATTSVVTTAAVTSGMTWTTNSAASVANLVNDGTVSIANGGSLDVTGAVDPSSNGIFQLTNKAVLELGAILGSGIRIQFLGAAPASKLVVDDPANFGIHAGTAAYAGPALQDFTADDTIDLKGLASGGVALSYTPATGYLQVTSGSTPAATLLFQNATLGAGGFHFTSDNAGGTLITHG